MRDRDRLILDNLNLARWHASRKRFHGPAVSYDDLYQAACIGLIKAADTWDSNQAPFNLWATLFIRREIRTELRRMLYHIRVPRTIPGQRAYRCCPIEDTVVQVPDEPHVDVAEHTEYLLTYLSPRTCAMVRLHFEEEWSSRRIATELGCSHTTVENHITRAIALMQRAQ